MSAEKDIERLFRLYYRPLCLYAAKFLADTETVEDVVQSVFISYWDRFHAGMVPSSPKSYLYRSVHNKCLDELKGRTALVDIGSVDYDIVDEPDVDRSFIRARLWTALDGLPEKRRTILLMNKRDGMTYSEIASELGISENTVHVHITKALKILREGAEKIILNFFV